MRTIRSAAPIMYRTTVVVAAVAAAAVTGLGPGRARGQTSLYDPRFAEVRTASVAWDNRPGPRRQVVDVVCLVPDVPTFLEAVATWDQGHYFPVLIDGVELPLKFLRAFRPSRVVRYPARADAVPAGEIWDRAVRAVSRSWAAADAPDDALLPGDAPPAALGAVPPGVVVSAPESPALAGAVALAAGRFQPLLRWEPKGHAGDALALKDATELALGLEQLVAGATPRYDGLGDDCDFVTLAGDYPYRYLVNDQANAFDDLILRSHRDGRRWGFAGRLAGDPAGSVYRAMCSLFLRPSTAALVNTYDLKNPPWSEFVMNPAVTALGKALPVTHLAGPQADLSGWHRAFDPFNRFGLVLLNTHGHPTSFHLDAGPGQTADVPETVPTVVHMIHSYSAAAPDDPDTIAGRWLAYGAYVYFGAMNEPYLQAFRTPALLGSFLSENLPLSVAFRKLKGEVHAQPWKLVYFGDPLYRLRPPGEPAARGPSWEPVAAWPAYVEFRPPAADAAPDLRLNWALKTAIYALQTGTPLSRPPDLAGTLLGIDRGQLDPALRPLHDDLLVDTLVHDGRTADLIERLTQVPPAERSPTLRRHLETAQTAALQRAVARKDLRGAAALWADVVRAPGSAEFVATFTTRVGRLADTRSRQAEWLNRLRAAARSSDPANAPVLEAETKRINEALHAPQRGR